VINRAFGRLTWHRSCRELPRSVELVAADAAVAASDLAIFQDEIAVLKALGGG
jgi:hypothetical protein